MTIIRPPARHQCDPPSNDGTMRVKVPFQTETMTVPKPVEHGSLWQCTCGRWWLAGRNPMHGRGLWFAGGGLHWRRISAWNPLYRSRIRKAQRSAHDTTH